MMLHHGMELSLSCILNCKELLKTLCTWILGKINYSVHLHNDLFDIRTDIRWSTRSDGFSSINFITWYIYWLFMPRFDWIFSNPMVSMTHSTHLYTSICGDHTIAKDHSDYQSNHQTTYGNEGTHFDPHFEPYWYWMVIILENLCESRHRMTLCHVDFINYDISRVETGVCRHE